MDYGRGCNLWNGRRLRGMQSPEHEPIDWRSDSYWCRNNRCRNQQVCPKIRMTSVSYLAETNENAGISSIPSEVLPHKYRGYAQASVLYAANAASYVLASFTSLLGHC